MSEPYYKDDTVTQVQYVRRSRFVAGLQRPELVAMLQSGLQSGALVVLEDDDYLSKFPHQRVSQQSAGDVA